MPTLNQIQRLLPTPKHRYDKVVDKQNVFDIVKGTLDRHQMDASTYDLISKEFWKGNVTDTCKCIFDFCKKNIPYEAEPNKKQTGKTPEMILADAISGKENDCKHYGLFICGIIDSLHRQGYPIACKYRFASDIANEMYPKHVFAVVPTPKGEMWVDPVLKNLHQYHKYFYVLDKKPTKMAYYQVSGVSDNVDYMAGTSDNIFASVGAHGRGRAKFKKLAKKLAPGRLLLKIGGAPMRNAGLLLIKINFRQFARHLFELCQKPANKEKLKKMWTKFGGQWPILAHNINLGYKHYLKRKHKKMPANYHILSGVSGVGDNESVGFVLATAVATATPIIVALTTILKSLGRKPAPEGSEGERGDGTSRMADEHNRNEDGTGSSTHRDGTETEAGEDENGKQVLHVKKHRGNTLDEEQVPGDTDIETPERAHRSINNQYESPTGRDNATEGYVNRALAVKEVNEEIPNAKTGVEESVNVLTDWGRGVKNFLQNNKGLAITGGSLILIGVVVKSGIFHHTKGRR